MLAAADDARARAAALLSHVPLVAALTHPALRARHWRAISAAAGVAVGARDEAATLRWALDAGLGAHAAKVAPVAAAAEVEAEVEEDLNAAGGGGSGGSGDVPVAEPEAAGAAGGGDDGDGDGEAAAADAVADAAAAAEVAVP